MESFSTIKSAACGHTSAFFLIPREISKVMSGSDREVSRNYNQYDYEDDGQRSNASMEHRQSPNDSERADGRDPWLRLKTIGVDKVHRGTAAVGPPGRTRVFPRGSGPGLDRDDRGIDSPDLDQDLDVPGRDRVLSWTRVSSES